MFCDSSMLCVIFRNRVLVSRRSPKAMSVTCNVWCLWDLTVQQLQKK